MRDASFTRREFLKLIGAGSATLAVGGGLATAIEGAETAAGRAVRPNILVILADDLGYHELGVQGNTDIPTPNIDAIAKNGVRFTNGYVSCPVCSPTRAGLMTGRYQERFGHEFNPGPTSESVFGLPLSETTIASRLKGAGYKTALVGKWHLGSRQKYMPNDRGFDEFFGFLGGMHSYVDPLINSKNPIMRNGKPYDEKDYLTDALAREAVAFIDRSGKEPWFLYLAFNAVHAPLQAPEKYLKRFPDIKDQKRRTFAGMLSAMDDAVGSVMTALRKNGVEENTLVIFLSDNGGPTPLTTSSNLPLRGIKGQVYEGGIRLPYIIQWKGHVPAGVVSDKPVISLDVAPTAMAAAGVKADGAKFDGVNIVPYLSGETSGIPHETLYWRFGRQHAIRKGNWKLVRHGENEMELYDLSADISESKDLASSKPDKVKELNDQLVKWESELAKPLWKGGGKPRKRAGRQGAKQPAGAKKPAKPAAAAK